MTGRRGWELDTQCQVAAPRNLRDSSEGDQQRHVEHMWDKRRQMPALLECP